MDFVCWFYYFIIFLYIFFVIGIEIYFGLGVVFVVYECVFEFLGLIEFGFWSLCGFFYFFGDLVYVVFSYSIGGLGLSGVG